MNDEDEVLEPDCAICGEHISENEMAEMYNPIVFGGDSYIVHAECGLQRGWEQA
jgi:hypothetical protein